MKKIIYAILLTIGCTQYSLAQDSATLNLYPFRNTTLSFEERAADLVKRLTLKEKLSLMQNNAQSIERLGIPAYNWWNECLHGVARDGIATVFPQAIAIAASWDTSLVHNIATAISTEARAKHQEHIRKGERKIYQGLTMWTPNINIFRDPRWGRGQETYGEDPFLTSSIGVAFVKGLQGNNNTYFKVIATAKHFAVHSGSEYNRHFFDAVVNKEDLFNTYLPAFESLVKDGKVYSIMGAYNRINGVPACANAFLLDTLLRKKWGFKGYVVSDCGAINDIYKYHKYTPTLSKAGAMAVQAGCDLTCGNEYINIEASVKDGFISEAVIDTSVKRLQLALLKLGMYDNDSLVQYQQIPYKENNSPQNNLLAKQAALESMVLLKNKNKLLPLSKNYKTIAVVGPYAADNNVLQGNYNGTPEQPVHFLNGIKNKVGNSINIITSNFIYKPEKTYANTQHLQDSIALTVQSVKDAELIIFCGGISAKVEGEESKLEIQGFFHGDRTDITLPDVQLKTLQALKQMGKPIVLVLTNGSALAINWENENIDAIVDAWYPGQQGGNALADILFGDANPCGKLPVTFYQSVKDLPEFEDYSMHNRTYKYFKGKVLYPFGFGLSYASFTCRLQSNSATQRKVTEKDIITIPVVLSNNSAIDGKETIQVYASGKNNPNFKPIKLLVAFNKVMVKAKEQKTVLLKIPVSKLRQYDLSLNDYKVYKGDYLFQIGNSSADTQCAITVHVQ